MSLLPSVQGGEGLVGMTGRGFEAPTVLTGLNTVKCIAHVCLVYSHHPHFAGEEVPVPRPGAHKQRAGVF